MEFKNLNQNEVLGLVNFLKIRKSHTTIHILKRLCSIFQKNNNIEMANIVSESLKTLIEKDNFF
jgi:hypothetical protein